MFDYAKMMIPSIMFFAFIGISRSFGSTVYKYEITALSDCICYNYYANSIGNGFVYSKPNRSNRNANSI